MEIAVHIFSTLQSPTLKSIPVQTAGSVASQDHASKDVVAAVVSISQVILASGDCRKP